MYTNIPKKNMKKNRNPKKTPQMLIQNLTVWIFRWQSINCKRHQFILIYFDEIFYFAFGFVLLSFLLWLPISFSRPSFDLQWVGICVCQATVPLVASTSMSMLDFQKSTILRQYSAVTQADRLFRIICIIWSILVDISVT